MIIDFVFSLTFNNLIVALFVRRSSLGGPGGSQESLSTHSHGGLVHDGEVWGSSGAEDHGSEGTFSEDFSFATLILLEHGELDHVGVIRNRDLEGGVPDGLLGLLDGGGLELEDFLHSLESEEGHLLDHDGHFGLVDSDG